ncbi:MAG TPA: DUF1109 domain-containing protein [Rhizomicrobium sp.]|jgi:hypothetical protein|nr:DUF1109 domain-containing protein [Rhizomicrobium sp.]
MSDLARELAAGLAPVPRAQVPRRLLLGLAAGLVVSIVLVLEILGPRPDMAQAMHTPMFWAKLIYPLSLAVIAVFALERLARPAASARSRVAWLPVPVILVILLALIAVFLAPPSARETMLMGQSARICPFLVSAFAVPPLAGLIWAMRGLAPTRLREAGLIIGLAAGGAGAFAYAWHCTETGAPFLAVWYSLGIAAAALLGWLTGPHVLRW